MNPKANKLAFSGIMDEWGDIDDHFPAIHSPLLDAKSTGLGKKEIKKKVKTPIRVQKIDQNEKNLKKRKNTMKVKSHLSEKLALRQGKLFFYTVLDNDVKLFISKINQKEMNKEVYRMATYQRFMHVVQQSFKNVTVSLAPFGSWATKMLTPNSDIDLCICGFERFDRQAMVSVLETVERNLKQFGWVEEIKPIYTAKIPVMKVVSGIKMFKRSLDKRKFSLL